MSNDVVITGLGATTPLGGDVETTWQGLLTGRSGVSTLDTEWVRKFDLPVKIAARLAVEPTEILPRVQARRLDRSEQVAMIAARQAWADAGFSAENGADGGVEPERLAVIIGTGIGGATTLLDQDDLLETTGLRKVSPLTVPMLMPNGPAAHVGLELKARAGVHAPVSACASGAEALAWGWRMLRTGEADVVVAGGAEAAIAAITMAGFAQARTMSTRNDDPERASRPWDVNRDGFVLGEGAGIVVLEREEFAKARGARVYGSSPGSARAPTRTTSPAPTRRAPARHAPSPRRCAAPDCPVRTSGTSTPTPPRPRSVTSAKPWPCARPSVSTRCSPRQARSGTCSAPPVPSRRSPPCCRSRKASSRRP